MNTPAEGMVFSQIRYPVAGLIVYLGLLFFSWPAHIQSGDNTLSIATARAIVNEGSLLIDAQLQNSKEYLGEVAEGKTYSRFGIGVPLLYVPVVWTENLLGVVVDNHELLGHVLFSMVPPLFGIVLWVSLYGCFRKLEASPLWGTALTLGTTVFTYVFRYATYDFSEIIQSALFVTAFLCLLQREKAFSIAGFWILAFCILIKPYNVGIYMVFLVYESIRTGMFTPPRASGKLFLSSFFRSMAGCLVPGLVAGIIYLALNWIRWGSLTETGYGTVARSFALEYVVKHALPLLFSLEMGLFVFAPLSFAGLAGWLFCGSRYRAEGLLAGGVSLFLYGLSASFYWPSGAWALGPRYLVPVVPFLAIGLCFMPKALTRLSPLFAYGVKAVLFVMIAAGLGLSVLFSLQKDKEYDLIRNDLLGSAVQTPPQIIGMALLLEQKLAGSEQVYPRKLLDSTADEKSVIDVRSFETFRGFNTWYSHLGNRVSMLLVRVCLPMHLLLFMTACLGCLYGFYKATSQTP